MSKFANNTNSKPFRLFISKSAEELELLPDFCTQNDILLNTHSFLSFEEVSFQPDKSFDAVFFASPRAVRFFTAQSDCSDKLIAVAGERTKKTVEALNLEVDFSPKNSGNIEESSLEFAQWLDGKSVLFPTSDISQKSYTRELNYDQFEILQVYKTIISTQKIEQNDIYVFTSPSNVKGFLKANSIPERALIVAWGETTFNALKSHIDTSYLLTLGQSSEERLIELLKENIFI